MVHLRAGLAQAEVAIDSGRPFEAQHDLNTIQALAKHDGFAAFELEARLLLAKAELRVGRPRAARARLDRLQSDASRKTFLLIARQALASLPAAN
jgi:hypothetical protein